MYLQADIQTACIMYHVLHIFVNIGGSMVWVLFRGTFQHGDTLISHMKRIASSRLHVDRTFWSALHIHIPVLTVLLLL